MVKRIGGSRRKARQLYSVPKKEKGKLTTSGFVQKFDEGDDVILYAKPAILQGMYFRRYHGKSARVVGMQGACYKVQLMNGGVRKTLIVAPVHLRKITAAVKME